VISTARASSLAASYHFALSEYLRAPSEESLTLAYDLGRLALEQGLGVVDWATVHGDALADLGQAGLDAEALRRSGAFFRESLSPFEMTQRGYAESHRWLERLNADLRQQVAERERLAAELRDSNAELEAFSYSVAHDLRAPLRHIDGFSQVLLGRHGPALETEAQHALKRIQNAVRRMGDLIDSLLRLSQMMRAQPDRQPLDLAPSARAIIERLRQTEPERSVEVRIADQILAEGDRKLLDAVLENLLGNAWKFTSKTSRALIEVGVSVDRSPSVYFIRDNGAGFDMAHAAKLFGVFERLHSAKEFPGTGIGLATVQRVVRRHGGQIWAEGTPNAGATFYFTLASTPAPASPTSNRR
jgi:light-regulated signal transduction histidine kinase (bacteriophytochrome)